MPIIFPVPDELKQTVHEVEELIYKKDYLNASSSVRGGRLNAQDIKLAIEEGLKDFGHNQITLAPEESYNKLEAVMVRNSSPPQYFIDLDLWMDGKESDLTLQLFIIQNKEGKYIATVDNIHIL